MACCGWFSVINFINRSMGFYVPIVKTFMMWTRQLWPQAVINGIRTPITSWLYVIINHFLYILRLYIIITKVIYHYN